MIFSSEDKWYHPLVSNLMTNGIHDIQQYDIILQCSIDIHYYDIFNVSRSLVWLQLLRVHWTSCSQTLKIKRFHNFSGGILKHMVITYFTTRHCIQTLQIQTSHNCFWVNFQAHDCHPLYHQACDIPAHEAFLEKFGRILHHNHVYIIRAKYWI